MKTNGFYKKLFLAALILITLMYFGCSRKISTRNAVTDLGTAPPTPDNLTISISDQGLTLTWEVDDPSEIWLYKIYRADSTEEFSLIDSAGARLYADTNLRNGVTYSYQISSVDTAGFEGYRSEIVSATPEIYAVIIADNLNVIATVDVTLTLMAPAATRYMKISNDSLFTNAIWEEFAPTHSWRLAPPDGEKNVYVSFRDQDDNPSSHFYFDSIILDRVAVIDSVLENTGGATMTTGDTIRFRVFAGETNGVAYVEIGEDEIDIVLYDDGTNGDETADDGVYSLNYIIPPDLEVTNAVITGNFGDEAGNIAPEKPAAGRVTIQNPPDAVQFLPPVATPNSSTSIDLNWSQSQASDFSFYRIYRDTAPGVTQQDDIVTTINGITVTAYADTGLTENTMYYYRVFVYDQSNLSSGSNEDSASSGINTPPTQPHLFEPSNPTLDEITLFWDQNRDADFYAYRVFRDISSPVDTGSTLIYTATSQTTITYTDTGLDAGTQYYFRLYAYDRGGLFTGSNEVSASTTTDDPPEAVTLYDPFNITTSTMTLSWTESLAEDFTAYFLFRAEQSNFSDSIVVSTFSSSGATSFIDTGLTDSTTYYYKVAVIDEGGNSTSSNLVSALTDFNTPPEPVVLSSPYNITDSSLSLSWSINNDDDFSSYRLFRSLNRFTGDSTLIEISSDRYHVTHDDGGLDAYTQYFYRVIVYDDGGLFSVSNMDSALTDSVNPPTPVTLAPVRIEDSSGVSLRFTWEENIDEGFDFYRIYGDVSPAIDTSRILFEIINNQQTTTTIMDNFEYNTTYYFQIFVFNRMGRFVGSNEVSILTPNAPMAPPGQGNIPPMKAILSPQREQRSR
ncbi:MAG: hypothetical protein GY855_11375 [candidate division Zixibacteria bacterium]|nr:hypothetical protein [candidate division Zixibacteria bacterium]